jgi:hypothetical protein
MAPALKRLALLERPKSFEFLLLSGVTVLDHGQLSMELQKRQLLSSRSQRGSTATVVGKEHLLLLLGLARGSSGYWYSQSIFIVQRHHRGPVQSDSHMGADF